VKNERVLIVGGGIAGPALAIELSRRGFRPTVVERSAAPRDGGYKVDVRGVAIDVLDRMGVLEAARARDCGVREVAVIGEGLEEQAAFDANYFFGRGARDIEVLRGDLGKLLRDACSGVEIVFGRHPVNLVDNGERVEVELDSGERRVFDLVIGCDGLHSTVRRQLFGGAGLKEMNHGVCVFTTKNDFGLTRREWMYMRSGRLLNLYAVSGQATCWVLLIFRGLPSPPPTDAVDQHALVERVFAADGPEVKAIVARGLTATDWFFDTMAQVHIPAWSKGRVALLGDACACASPASGQGTSLALVGAHVLAQELERSQGEHQRAFEDYERRMRPFVDVNQALGRELLAEMTPQGAWQDWTRRTLMRALPYMPWRNCVFRQMNEKIARAANAIALASDGDRQ
jgi:2-polyprenyl-6-methoxyphenol hydroxylase-like FAD-dependent oxidoreductase